MDDRTAQEILSRLKGLEARLDSLETRISNLEPRKIEAPEAAPSTFEIPEPPPVIRAEVFPPAPAALEQVEPEPELVHDWAGINTVRPTKMALTEDLEYKIGRIGLLRGGAVVFLVGILYLVALAISRHQVSPQMQFVGEQVLCAAFIVLGFIKRNEKEEFGQLMTGIGSSGLYLSFAGGYVFKHIFPSNVLVLLFLLLSFANLGYAHWRASRSFFALGMIGGFVAAMLPMHDYNAPVNVALHFVVLVPCAIIAARNRWQDLSVWLYAASMLALIPVYTYANHLWGLRVASLYADSLVCAALYGIVYRSKKWDSWCVLPGIMTFIAGAGAVAIEGVRNGSFHVIYLAAGAALIGTMLRAKPDVRNAFHFSALMVLAVLAPMGYSRTEAAVVFILVSVGLSIASTRLASVPLQVLSLAELVLAVSAYQGIWLTNPPPLAHAHEMTVLVGMIVGIVLLAIVAAKKGLVQEFAATAGSLAVIPFLERLATISAPRSGPTTPIVATFFTTILAAGVLCGLSRRLKLTGVLVLAGMLLIASGALYATYSLGQDRDYRFLADLGMLATLSGAIVAFAPIGQPRLTSPADYDTLVGGCAVTVGFCLIQTGRLLLPHYAGFTLASGMLAGSGLMMLAMSLSYLRTKRQPLQQVGWLGLIIQLFFRMNVTNGAFFPMNHEALIAACTIPLIALLGWITFRQVSDKLKQAAVVLPGALLFIYLERCAYLVLTHRFHFDASGALATGGLVGTVAAGILFHRGRQPGAVILAWGALATYLVTIMPWSYLLSERGGYRHEAPLLLFAIPCTLMVSHITSRVSSERTVLTGAIVILEWALITRLLTHLMRHSGISPDAVVSAAWTAFAASAILVGFRYRMQLLRYWSLAVFGLTLIKVFAIDLAFLDSGVRVAILMFLGLCMVGGGYAYVRSNQSKGLSPTDVTAGDKPTLPD